jgi:hypothetical protein
VKAAIERRLQALEGRRETAGRTIHFIKATDQADSDRQIAELRSSGKVGSRDSFLSLTGWIPLH